MAESDFVTWYSNNVAIKGSANGTCLANYTSPYFKYWELGVGLPIKNSRFAVKKRIRKLLSANVIVGATSFKFTEGSNLLALIARNEIAETFSSRASCLLRISKADWSYSEIIELHSSTPTSVSGSEVTVNLMTGTTFANAFSTNDIMEFVSPLIADGWNAFHHCLQPMGLLKAFPLDFNNLIGDMIAQRVVVTGAGLNTYCYGGSTYQYFETSYPTDIDRWTSYDKVAVPYYYRFGAAWRLSVLTNITNISWATTSIGMVSTLVSPNGEWINLLPSTMPTGFQQDKLYVSNSAGFASNTLKNPPTLRATAQQVGFDWHTGVNTHTSNEEVRFDIHDIWYEHSAGLESVLGCVVLQVPPQRESIAINKVEGETETFRLANNGLYAYHPKGNPNEFGKYQISCTFESVPIGMLRKLQKLESFQNDGFMINLHPKYPDLPQCLQGRLKVSNIRKAVYAFDRVTFDFEFEEA